MLCSHVRPACGGTLSRVSAASLRPYLIPACVRASAAGLRPYLIPASGGRLHAVQVSLKGGGLNDEKMKCQVTYLPSRKIGDPLYTTFQKIFTIIRIFLKSEAPKALYSSHSFIVSALITGDTQPRHITNNQ